MLQPAEQQLQILSDVAEIVQQFDGPNSAPLVRDFQKRVSSAIDVCETTLDKSNREKQEILDALDSGQALPFSGIDVCGVWLSNQFGDTVIFCDQLIGAIEKMLASIDHNDANRKTLAECKQQLDRLHQAALDAFREVARHWPWLDKSKTDDARAFFDAGGKGISLEAVIDGLRD